MHSNNDSKYFLNGILQKDRIILSKAITLVESTNKDDQKVAEELLQACLSLKKSSKRIAITGSPGAGKSTFINAFGKLLLDNNNSLAVLAIDPSSSKSKGSILGDKTRMEDLVGNNQCYIRPTASNNNLGGVARNTRAAIILCETYGFDYIFIETVGVGQSETMVKNMVDLFLLLLLPNSGDELQGIKRGIMEMADILLINKSEKENEITAKVAAVQVKRALHLQEASEKDWIPQVINISSINKIGFDELIKQVDAYFLKIESSGFLSFNRNQQDLFWLEENILEELKQTFADNKNVVHLKKKLEEKNIQKEISAVQAAKLLVEKFLEK